MSDYILQTKREIEHAIMCSFFFFFFFLPDRPTHLQEREGDGKRNILWGWPYLVLFPWNYYVDHKVVLVSSNFKLSDLIHRAF